MTNKNGTSVDLDGVTAQLILLRRTLGLPRPIGRTEYCQKDGTPRVTVNVETHDHYVVWADALGITPGNHMSWIHEDHRRFHSADAWCWHGAHVEVRAVIDLDTVVPVELDADTVAALEVIAEGAELASDVAFQPEPGCCEDCDDVLEAVAAQ